MWSVSVDLDQTADENIHVIPVQDLREHEFRPQCWCKPAQDEEFPDLWTHNAMDQRELYENGERLAQ